MYEEFRSKETKFTDSRGSCTRSTSFKLEPYHQKELDYEKRIFNYRLSRDRCIMKNTFGNLANCFPDTS
nr:unnamed protein product [Callosobruchus analis]